MRQPVRKPSITAGTSEKSARPGNKLIRKTGKKAVLNWNDPVPECEDQPACAYRRERDLPPLVALWPIELADYSQTGTALIIQKLQKSLRHERQRAQQNHWTYNIVRHLGLLKALKGEKRRYAVLTRTGNK